MVVLKMFILLGMVACTTNSKPRCKSFDNPKNGYITCDSLFHLFCSPECHPGYRFATKPAVVYMCGPVTGEWFTYPVGHMLPWPDCIPDDNDSPDTIRSELADKRKAITKRIIDHQRGIPVTPYTSTDPQDRFHHLFNYIEKAKSAFQIRQEIEKETQILKNETHGNHSLPLYRLQAQKPRFGTGPRNNGIYFQNNKQISSVHAQTSSNSFPNEMSSRLTRAHSYYQSLTTSAQSNKNTYRTLADTQSLLSPKANSVTHISVVPQLNQETKPSVLAKPNSFIQQNFVQQRNHVTQPSVLTQRSQATQPSALPQQNHVTQPSGLPQRNHITQPSVLPQRNQVTEPSALPQQNQVTQPSGLPQRNQVTKPSALPQRNHITQPSVLPQRNQVTQPSALSQRNQVTQPSGLPQRNQVTQPSGLPQQNHVTQPSGIPQQNHVTQPSVLPQQNHVTQPSVLPQRNQVTQPSVLPQRNQVTQPSVLPQRNQVTKPSGLPQRNQVTQPSVLPQRNQATQASALPQRNHVTQPSVLSQRNQVTQPSALPQQNQVTQPSVLPQRNQATQPSALPQRNQVTQPSALPQRNQVTQPSVLPQRNQATQPSALPQRNQVKQPSALPQRNQVTQPSALPQRNQVTQPSALPQRNQVTQPSVFLPQRNQVTQPSALPQRNHVTQPSVLPQRNQVTQPKISPQRNQVMQPSILLQRNQVSPRVIPNLLPQQNRVIRPSILPQRNQVTQPSDLPHRNQVTQPPQRNQWTQQNVLNNRASDVKKTTYRVTQPNNISTSDQVLKSRLKVGQASTAQQNSKSIFQLLNKGLHKDLNNLDARAHLRPHRDAAQESKHFTVKLNKNTSTWNITKHSGNSKDNLTSHIQPIVMSRDSVLNSIHSFISEKKHQFLENNGSAVPHFIHNKTSGSPMENKTILDKRKLHQWLSGALGAKEIKYQQFVKNNFTKTVDNNTQHSKQNTKLDSFLKKTHNAADWNLRMNPLVKNSAVKLGAKMRTVQSNKESNGHVVSEHLFYFPVKKSTLIDILKETKFDKR